MIINIKNLIFRFAYPKNVKQKNINGEYVYFRANSPIEFYRTNMYGGEKPFLDYFCKQLLESDIVFDVGSSVGLVSVYAASIVKKGCVYSFEPDPETYQSLKKNISVNNLRNVNLNMIALSDKDGRETLFTDGASGFAPSMREQKNRIGAPKKPIVIETKMLDTIIEKEKFPVPSVLKVDIEGAEVLFLRGASKLLGGFFGKKPRLVFMEIHPKFLSQFESSCQEVVDEIMAHGYDIGWSESRENEVQYCFFEKG